MQAVTRRTLNSALVHSSRLRQSLLLSRIPDTRACLRRIPTGLERRCFSVAGRLRYSTGGDDLPDSQSTRDINRESNAVSSGGLSENVSENAESSIKTATTTSPIPSSSGGSVESQNQSSVSPDDGGEEPTDERSQQQQNTKRGRPVGSKSRRQVSGTTKPKDAKPEIPQWFYDHGVLLNENICSRPPRLEIVKENDWRLDPESTESGEPALVSNVASEVDVKANPTIGEAESTIKKALNTMETEKIEPTENPQEVQGAISNTSTESESSSSIVKEKEPEAEGKEEKGHSKSEFQKMYSLHEHIWKEILAHVRAGMMLPKASFGDSLAAMKSNCLLHFPKEGGVYHLDAVVERIAAEVDADVVRIDAQDLEEIGGDHLGDSRYLAPPPSISSHSMRSLGYDAQLTDIAKEEDIQEFEEEEEFSDEEDSEPNPSSLQVSPTNVRQLLKTGMLLVPIGAVGSPMSPDGKQVPTVDQINERKMSNILKALVGAASAKRIMGSAEAQPDGASEETPLPSKTIIHVRDYGKLENTTQGGALLRMLREIVSKKRRDGESMIIIGTSSVQKISAQLNKANMAHVQSLPAEGMERTIIVTPIIHGGDELYVKDRQSRIKEVNIRHLRDIIRRRSGDGKDSVILNVPIDWHLLDAGPEVPSIEKRIWNFDRVHRVAVTVLGEYTVSDNKTGELTVDEVAAAVHALDSSDNVKWEWAAKEKRWLKEEEEKESEEGDELVKEEEDSTYATRMKKITKTANTHEKNLLGGVINPDKIHTTFSSVRAPPETIEALKTLTSLSLIRPEAFQYGVLATDKIPGVLLYGPPGTGKTLLAKAVAKESGATVLEVSGSEIFDMYVGEGEKNVKAIFSLAQKLSPCVVFIDEADAIFGSRNSLHTRNTHREIINQFLKEWADFASSSAFIMVATNRPFDLDDAVLRRLPRRILVDLPLKEDRYEILKIHLKDEVLDPEIDLSKLAGITNLYSGSDLKNLCVSAALACVREETEANKDHGTAFPEKRILRQCHFNKAMEEITASISDDMSSLMAIRKFDEKYGEKAGRRNKKGAGWGFAGKKVAEAPGEAEEGSGRVRRAIPN